MPPSGTLPLTILVLFCEASECIPSSVVVPACLSSFSSILPTRMMLLLHNGYWHGPCAFTRSILTLSVWMQPIGACVSLPGSMACWEPWPSFLGIPDVKRIAPACLLPGPQTNWANEAALNASSGAFFSSFISNAHPYLVGLRLSHRSL